MAALLARANLYPDLFLGEGFDSLGHPAGHGGSAGPGQPGIVEDEAVEDY